MGRQAIAWTLAFAAFVLLRTYGIETPAAETLALWEYALIIVPLSIVTGVVFGGVTHGLERFERQRRLSFLAATALNGVVFLALLTGVALLATALASYVLLDDLRWAYVRDLALQGSTVLFLGYCFVVGILVDGARQVSLRFGPGNLLPVLNGTYRVPTEVERVFMFLDLHSSTAIAERLEHIRYSAFVQDYFRDLAVVHRHGAEVYQYVGDEAVLTWTYEGGFRQNACLAAYFAFERALLGRTAYYTTHYGVIPVFKAGIHCGTTMVAEVGTVKREIAYHGDAVNTAARIQCLCNGFGARLLVSGAVATRVDSGRAYELRGLGQVKLRGRTEGVKVYAVEEV